MAGQYFQSGGAGYAHHRPSYPAALAETLAKAAPGRGLAVDVGCGSGQLSILLAAHMDAVLATDVSADQVEHATPHPKVRYAVGPAEAIARNGQPLADHSADLITAAQAAHWFDLPRFYDEVRRIGRHGALLALVTYGVMRVDGPMAERFERFYWREIHPHWPPERALVETGYADLDFPFQPAPLDLGSIERRWTLENFLGYLSTWSAVRQAEAAGRSDILADFTADCTALWGDPATEYLVTWPIGGRVGTVP